MYLAGHGGHQTSSPLGPKVAERDPTELNELEKPLGDVLYSVTGR